MVCTFRPITPAPVAPPPVAPIVFTPQPLPPLPQPLPTVEQPLPSVSACPPCVSQVITLAPKFYNERNEEVSAEQARNMQVISVENVPLPLGQIGGINTINAQAGLTSNNLLSTLFNLGISMVTGRAANNNYVAPAISYIQPSQAFNFTPALPNYTSAALPWSMPQPWYWNPWTTPPTVTVPTQPAIAALPGCPPGVYRQAAGKPVTPVNGSATSFRV